MGRGGGTGRRGVAHSRPAGARLRASLPLGGGGGSGSRPAWPGATAPRCLLGYSMGGRLALAAALDHPHLVDGLVLMFGGVRPGHRERAPGTAGPATGSWPSTSRRWACAAFVAEWLAQPLFAGLRSRSAEWRARGRGHPRLQPGRRCGGGPAPPWARGHSPTWGARSGELRMPVLLSGRGGRRAPMPPPPATWPAPSRGPPWWRCRRRARGGGGEAHRGRHRADAPGWPGSGGRTSVRLVWKPAED